MHFISFCLLFFAITSVLYGTSEVFPRADLFTPSVEFTKVGGKEEPELGGIEADLVSSPPDIN